MLGDENVGLVNSSRISSSSSKLFLNAFSIRFSDPFLNSASLQVRWNWIMGNVYFPRQEKLTFVAGRIKENGTGWNWYNGHKYCKDA